MNNIKNSNFMKICSVTLGIFAVLVIAFFIIGGTYLPRETKGFDEKFEELDVEWYQVFKDGSRAPIDVPGRYDVPRGEEFISVCTLPDIPDAGYQLLLRSSQQDMYVYIDGEIREVYDSKDTRIWGNSSMSCNVLADISDKDSGKELRVVTRSNTSYSGVANAVYYGTSQGIFHDQYDKYVIGLIIAFLLLFASTVSLIICFFLQVRYKKEFPMTYASWTGIIVSVEAIAESRLRQYYIGNMEIAGSVSYMLVGLIPIAILMYINCTQRRRYEKWIKIFLGFCFVNFILNFLLQIFNIQDFLVSMTRSYFLFALSFVFWIITTIKDYKDKNLNGIRIPSVGIFLSYILGMMEIVAAMNYYLTITGIFINAGMFILLSAAIMDSVNQIILINHEKGEAIAANNAKSGFLANMSHEIRTPINTILGMNEMIQRESSENNIKEYSNSVSIAGTSLLEIVNDILDFSKIESGKMDIVEVEYSLKNVVFELEQLVAKRAKDKNLKLKFEVDENLPEFLFGDEVRIKQIILNLLTNAIKYTNEGTVTLSIVGHGTFASSDMQEKLLLHIEVKDTGIGIKEDDINKLFNKFERVDLKNNRLIEGTGLGLAITSNLVNLMHGRLDVESVYGEGSVFMIDLPQGKVKTSTKMGSLSKEEKKPEEKVYRESFHAPDAHILVVDDNSINLKVIKGLLKSTLINIDEATSGKMCIEMCRNNSYDLIFMDHMMPEMDGIETLSLLLEEKLIDCPVVALTANAISGMEEMYLSKGFDGYLSKPVVPDKLEEMLRNKLPSEKVELMS